MREVTWIYQQPNLASRKLGSMAVGLGIPLRDKKRRHGGSGCASGFYAVEPRGYVCLGKGATLDANHPVVAGVQAHAPRQEAPTPYRYGLSLGAPMYNRIPSEEIHSKVMMRFLKKPPKLADWAKSFRDLVLDQPIEPDSDVPSFLRNGSASPTATDGAVRRSIPHTSMISYVRAFEHAGRTWLLTPDLSVVPADRVLPYRPSEFRGVELDEKLSLPLGWVRNRPRPKFAESTDGSLKNTGDTWAARAAIALTGQTKVSAGRRYLETREPGIWVRNDHVRKARAAKRLPEGVGNDGKWIRLSMLENTLVAYQGLRPVYATLHSPGRGGSHRGKGDVRNYTTPLGSFHINWKERWSTFSPDPGAPTTFWISDVMWVQYFRQPYALHGAYWHERFGDPLSAGCPNLSPRDARWLFAFTEPALPDGWKGIAPARGDPTTLVVVGP